ncbi:WXG100 family type VII secretion target [Streptomyces sp. NPDC048370]|uniref:WXG100 family type VII secretion target n=1 Tax=Streptomyces sp. NPDC048370 TaxID=3365540 RepID=UPI00371E566D
MTSPAGGFGLAEDPVTQAKNKIMQTGEEVSKQAREMANILETVHAGWTGAGAAGFKTAQSALNEDHDTIRRLLNVLLTAVNETKNLSAANDFEVFQTLKANNSALNNI